MPQSTTTITCLGCGNDFRIHLSRLGRRRFCNHDCWRLHTRRQAVVRFWAKVSVGSNSECWLWNGALDQGGYGKLRLGVAAFAAHTIRASRFSYELHYGPIGDSGVFVCHRCDVRACVNPQHLFLGTHKENMHDMVLKGRNATVLTPALVRDIRRRYQDGERPIDIARSMGIPKAIVRRAAYRQTWKNVEGEE